MTTSTSRTRDSEENSVTDQRVGFLQHLRRRAQGLGLGMGVSSTLATAFGVALLTVLAWGRLPASTAQTLWAEDGGIFLRQAFNSNFFVGIFDPYEGYLHVVPRMLAHIALRLGPIEHYAVVISLLSCLVAALVGVAVFHLSRQLVGSVVTRVVLAVIPVLLPVVPFEVLGNTANLHWYMLWLVIWVVLYRPKRWVTSCGLAVIAFLAAATEIQTIVFLPVGIVAALRDRKRIPATIALAIGLAMQVSTALRFPRSVSPDVVPWDVPSVIIGWLLQGVYSTVQPSASSVGAAWTAVGGWVLVFPALFAVVTAIVGWRAGGLVRVTSLGLLAASGVFWAGAQILNNREFMNYAHMTSAEWANFGYLRYAVAPGMFFLGAVAISASSTSSRTDDRLDPRRSRFGRQAWWRPAALGAVALILSVNYFPSFTGRWNGPVWSSQVVAARVSCTSNPSEQSAVAVVAPAGWEYGRVLLPCTRLRK